MKKLLIPVLYLAQEQAVAGFGSEERITKQPIEDLAIEDLAIEDLAIEDLAAAFADAGADELLVLDLSDGDAAHEQAISTLIRICGKAEVPVIGGGNVRRMEDVKKILYAGCKKAVLNFAKESNRKLLEEVSKKFGREKMIVFVPDAEICRQEKEQIEALAGMVLCDEEQAEEVAQICGLPLLVLAKEKTPQELLQRERVTAVTGSGLSHAGAELMEIKLDCKKAGLDVNTFESRISWSEFKTNSDGMVPVIVQDYRTDEVLMLAYMNEEAFETTLSTGKMTYWSRSRNELWTKGLTSGHFQFVKSLTLDCDNDTILAKVSQVGAACHTGSRSCFFKELVKKEYEETNPHKVLQQVYDVICDRKVHPKEGSYTNYLFDKGIDKILKKVGEECTEIVIAAKNPDPEEIKYEISDFLYHVMVLMVEKGVSWEEITRELARR